MIKTYFVVSPSTTLTKAYCTFDESNSSLSSAKPSDPVRWTFKVVPGPEYVYSTQSYDEDVERMVVYAYSFQPLTSVIRQKNRHSLDFSTLRGGALVFTCHTDNSSSLIDI